MGRTLRAGAQIGAVVAVLGMCASCILFDPFDSLAPAASGPTDGGEGGGNPRGDASACEAGAKKTCGVEACALELSCGTDGFFPPCTAREPSLEICSADADESCDGVNTCTGEHRWALRMGDESEQQVVAMAVDPSGDVYIAGWFSGNLVLPPHGANAVKETMPQAGNPSLPDAFVAKLTRAGDRVWVRTVADTRFTTMSAGANDLVIGGVTSAATTLGGTCAPVQSHGGDDALVVRWSFAGGCTKAASFGSAEAQSVTSVAVLKTDEVVAIGTAAGTIDFGGTAGSFNVDAEKTSGFYVRLSASLTGKNAAMLRSNGIVMASVAADEMGRAVVAGTFGEPLEAFQAEGPQTMFLATYGDDGARLVLSPFGNGYTDPDKVVIAGEAVYIAGTFAGSLDLSSRKGPVLDSNGSGDLFLITAVDATLADLSLAKSFGGAGIERPRAMTVDRGGNVVLAGYVAAGLSTVGGATIEALPAGDLFVAKYDRKLAHVWSHIVTGSDGERAANAVAVNARGEVFVAGVFTTSVDFGDKKRLTAEGAGGGSPDIFVMMRRP